MTRRRRVPLAILVLDLLILAGVWGWYRGTAPRRIADRAGIIPALEERNYNYFLEQMHRESGIDLRIVLVPTVGTATPEQFALATMRELGIGRGTGRAPHRVRHARPHHADRGRAQAGGDSSRRLGGVPGAGARGPVLQRGPARDRAPHHPLHDPLAGPDGPAGRGVRSLVRGVRAGRPPARGGRWGFGATPGERGPGRVHQQRRRQRRGGWPGATIEDAYRRRQEWLALGRGQIDVPLFTGESQRFLTGLPPSPAFNAYLLATEYGRAYRIDRGGDLAMLYSDWGAIPGGT